MTTPQDTPRAVILEALDRSNADLRDKVHPKTREDFAFEVLAALSAAGYRIIQTDQAEHGDQLVKVGHRDTTVTPLGVQSMRNSWETEPVFSLRRVFGNEQDTAAQPTEETQ